MNHFSLNNWYLMGLIYGFHFFCPLLFCYKHIFLTISFWVCAISQSGKRRSSVLDDDLGSGGPIRRIRQKPNLLSHEVSGVSKHRLRLTQKVSNFVEENPDYRTPSTSRAHVPNKSCETAAKILEHLDKLTPKKKSSESKLASLKEKSPSKLTSMVDGQGVRIHEDSESSKLLQNARDSYKSEDHFSAATPDSHISGLPKLDSVKENGTKKLVDMANPLSNNELMHQNFVTPEKKHAYKTSSYEVRAISCFICSTAFTHSKSCLTLLKALVANTL